MQRMRRLSVIVIFSASETVSILAASSIAWMVLQDTGWYGLHRWQFYAFTFPYGLFIAYGYYWLRKRLRGRDWFWKLFER